MARRGENIYKRKDGRWEARYIKTYIDGKAKYGYCYAASYHAVKEKVSNVKTASNMNRPPAGAAAGEKSLSVCCDEWLILNRLKVKESTYVKYCTMIDNHIRPLRGGGFRTQIAV